MINNLSECTETIDEKYFFIKDGDEGKPALIIKENGEFEVRNNTNSPINFIKIDSCISNSNDGKRSDCVIYNYDTFCFIELKCIKPKLLANTKRKAKKQLESTINKFNNQDIIKNKKREAYMCFNCKIDGNYTQISKATNPSATITYFEDELNTSLYCDTKKEFN